VNSNLIRHFLVVAAFVSHFLYLAWMLLCGWAVRPWFNSEQSMRLAYWIVIANLVVLPTLGYQSGRTRNIIHRILFMSWATILYLNLAVGSALWAATRWGFRRDVFFNFVIHRRSYESALFFIGFLMLYVTSFVIGNLIRKRESMRGVLGFPITGDDDT
jgi:hypothetical protein